MPRAWSAKDERQYQHVKESERKRGRSMDRADEIAARTVNKERRLEGRTPSARTQGTGNPRSRLKSRSIDELRNRAARLSVAGRDHMSRPDLVAAIRQRNRTA